MTDAFETSLRIEAEPEQVFDHFTNPELMVKWMGEFARLQAVEDGLFSVDIDGVLIRGSYRTLDRPRFIEIAWGEAGNAQMPPGSTCLTISLEPSDSGTLLTLKHSGLVPDEAEKHAYGWPHFLARLAIASTGGEPGPYPWNAST
jgi:uncharacterized protein YndB with AHSA1/START domain